MTTRQSIIRPSNHMLAGIRHSLYQPLGQHFTGTYITVLSIVQGLALSLLLSRAVLDPPSHLWPGCPTEWVSAGAYVCVGLLIFSVWHHYVTYAQFVAWPLTIFDSLIPFGFGVLEALLVRYAGKIVPNDNCASDPSDALSGPVGIFLAYLASYYFVGTIAYLHARYRRLRGEAHQTFGWSLRSHLSQDNSPDETTDIRASFIKTVAHDVEESLTEVDRRGVFWLLGLFGLTIVLMVLNKWCNEIETTSGHIYFVWVEAAAMFLFLIRHGTVHRELAWRLKHIGINWSASVCDFKKWLLADVGLWR